MVAFSLLLLPLAYIILDIVPIYMQHLKCLCEGIPLENVKLENTILKHSVAIMFKGASRKANRGYVSWCFTTEFRMDSFVKFCCVMPHPLRDQLMTNNAAVLRYTIPHVDANDCSTVTSIFITQSCCHSSYLASCSSTQVEVFAAYRL